MNRLQPSLAVARLEETILMVRGQKVMLDNTLAELYGVPTKALLQAVRRNVHRFPGDFVFQLSVIEFEALRSQSVTSKGRGGRRYPPYAFTEHGAIMLASVLNSDRAIQASIYIVRAFVRLREAIMDQKTIEQKFIELDRRIGSHDKEIRDIVQAIRQLMVPPGAKRRRIGFESESK